MMGRAGAPNGGRRLPEGGGESRLGAAYKHGLGVFGVFFAVAVGFFFVTFVPFKRIDGPMELPLPEWIMMLPTFASLAAGVLAGLVVMTVDLVRGRTSPPTITVD